MWGIFSSFLGSFLLALFLFGLYAWSARRLRGKRTFARDLWWLPAWSCWRFVVRNMEGDSSLRSLRFRTWLRDIEPARPGSSVKSFIDTELGSGERLLLPAEQDLPILCFRFELQGDRLALVHTDKLGTPKAKFLLAAQREYALMAEYTFNISSPFGIPHSLNRLLAIPRYLERECDEKFDLYTALYKQQDDVEQWVAVKLSGEEYISVPLP